MTQTSATFSKHYVAVIFDAVFPEVPHRELWSDDHRGPENHHETDAHHAPGRVIQWQWIIKN